MNDDLGRGMLAWAAERWQALDDLATKTLGEQVVLRHLVDEQAQKDVYNVRIAGQNVDIGTIHQDFDVNMADDDDTDVDRKVRLAAQKLAVQEDQTVLEAMDLKGPQRTAKLLFKEFSKAKNALRSKGGVQTGLGVVVSTDALTDLETEVVGAQSGLDVTEKLLSTKLMQSNALPQKNIEAVVVQATPPSYRLVRSWGPRLRVLEVNDGKDVKLSLEQGIAVGQLEPNCCLAIERTSHGS